MSPGCHLQSHNIMETTAWKTAGTLSGLRVSRDSLTNVDLDNRGALGYILAEQEGYGQLPIPPVSPQWINNTRQVEVDVCETHDQAK